MNKKVKIKVGLDEDVLSSLENGGSRYGMTANALLAAAGYELSRVAPEDYFRAISRISEGSSAAPMLSRPRRQAVSAEIAG